MSALKKITGLLSPGPSSVEAQHSDLLSRKAAAEAAIVAAEAEHRKACLATERSEGGAIERKVEAFGAWELAKQRLRDIESAILELHAEIALREAQTKQVAVDKAWDATAKALKNRDKAAQSVQ